MRKNEKEWIFSKYTEMDKIKINSIKHRSRQKKGASLETFYQEAKVISSLKMEHVYNGKSADEITRIMVENRRAIEANKRNRP